MDGDLNSHQAFKRLEERGRKVRYSGRDAKWGQLSTILDDPLMTDEHGNRRKLIIFTEAKDTLFYLAEKIRTLRGRHEEVVVIHGGVRREERRQAVEAFVHDPNVRMSRGGEAKPVQEADEGLRTRESRADDEGLRAEGQLERAGSARYPYGSHALVAPGDRTIRYILRSDTVQLREFEGQRVRISASVVEGYPPNEGDPSSWTSSR